MGKKTKILAVGDIHGDTGLVKRLAEKAVKENIDLVILAGDLTFAESSVKNLIGPFIKAKKQVLLIPGNHESMATADFLAEMYPNTKNIHGYSFRKDDLGIFGAGAGDIGINQIKDSEIFELLKRGHESIKDLNKKIMVTHMHPKGSKQEFSGFQGSDAVRRAIKQFKPNVLITAHIHEAAGMEEEIGKTKVINVSRKEKIFEI
ncbi:MAG: metallophosphoesterase [Candidatus Pacearchaeota archaeon]|nr:metallophosphoesterase [Candidatus Pacearchaeota archaeon]